MNNEEKILSILEQLQQGQAKLEQGQAKLEQDVTFIRQTVAKIEYDHGQKLNLLFEGNAMNLEKGTQLAERLYALEKIVARHDSEIIALKASRAK